MEAVVITHASSEWDPPKQLDINIRKRIGEINPDRVFSLYRTEKYPIEGAAHIFSDIGFLPEEDARLMASFDRLYMMGLYHNLCHYRSFKSAYLGFNLAGRRGSLVMPTDCIVADNQSALLSDAMDKYSLDEDWSKYDAFLAKQRAQFERTLDLSKGPDVTYSFAPRTYLGNEKSTHARLDSLGDFDPAFA